MMINENDDEEEEEDDDSLNGNVLVFSYLACWFFLGGKGGVWFLFGWFWSATSFGLSRGDARILTHPAFGCLLFLLSLLLACLPACLLA
jgi:hypothetical protein